MAYEPEICDRCDNPAVYAVDLIAELVFFPIDPSDGSLGYGIIQAHSDEEIGDREYLCADHASNNPKPKVWI
jgi:hypothetical protein